MSPIIYRFFLSFSLIVLFSISSKSQFGFIPHKLDYSINSPFSEFNPVISFDGKILYFTRASHPENNHNLEEHFGPEDSEDIWFSRLQPDGKWTKAQRMPSPLNTAYYNSILSILDDRKTVLLNGIFDKHNKWIKRGLSFSSLGGEGWTHPVPLYFEGKLRKNKGKVSSAFITGDNQLLFLSFSTKYNSTREDLYMSKRMGSKWSKPVKFSSVVNTKKFSETAPYFSVKEQKLYFSSNRNAIKSNPDNYDIYYTKASDKNLINWTPPIRLNDTINSKKWESYFKLNEESSIAYFARTDSGKTSDIYMIKLKEDNPFVQISGIAISNFNNEPLDPKYEFKIYANDQIIDSSIIHTHSSHFTVKLPLGKKYYIKAQAKNHLSIIDSVDVTGIKEFTEIEKDLYLSPVPYVVLSGKILMKNAQTALPDSSAPKIFINGKPANNFELNKKTGEYLVNLKFGVKHQITVKAKGYDLETATIDLTPVNKYAEINRDFLLQKYIAPEANEAIITGQIIDKKTGKPISSDKSFSIVANDIPATEVNINSKTAEYKLVVPLGKQYVINATSANYYPIYETIDLKNQTTSTKINKNLILAPIEVGMSVKLNNIFFETGKAALKKESFPELGRIIKFLKENETMKIEIAGHTDNVGSPEGNIQLSQLRANAVLNHIKSAGINQGRLISKGYGSGKPLTSNKSKKDKAANRRVEFTILEK